MMIRAFTELVSGVRRSGGDERVNETSSYQVFSAPPGPHTSYGQIICRRVIMTLINDLGYNKSSEPGQLRVQYPSLSLMMCPTSIRDCVSII